jgi:hypothetical protein
MRSTTIITLLVILSSTHALATPRPDEYHKEVGCYAFPATTRTPYCTPLKYVFFSPIGLLIGIRNLFSIPIHSL